MAHWVRRENRSKSQVFVCSKCHRECNCICYVGEKNVCDYKFCPYCGEEMKEELQNGTQKDD